MNGLTIEIYKRGIIMDELNLKELFDYFKERIVILLVIIIISVAVGSMYSFFIKVPLYQSTSTVLLVSNDSGATTSSDVTLNKSLLGTYSEIVTSRLVVDQVIENLKLDISTQKLQQSISVSSITDTQIIKISVMNEDNELASRITNELVKVFVEVIKQKMDMQNVSLIDRAQTPMYAYNINYPKEIVIYIIIGIIIALSFIFVMFCFDTTIKSSDEVEAKTGLPIFGIIPKVKK